jgi:hypothetical protein
LIGARLTLNFCILYTSKYLEKWFFPLHGARVDWDTLTYIFGSKLNMNLLVKQCRLRGFTIKGFKPAPDWQLEVEAQGWGSNYSRITFENTDGGSRLLISPLGTFSRKFYEIVNPENVLDFIKDCFQ